ncbi:glutamate-ammonia-ligase adenylyltransferase [bacterium]|nr:glutamate-ammonia-ligase adenylyltransferase [bacterium]
MKPHVDELLHDCPDIDVKLIENHLNRLDERYFMRFDLPAIVRHVTGLAKLSASNPVEILTEQLPDGRVVCTTLAFDYSAEFSLITGLLSGLGFNIHSGGIHTYARVSTLPQAGAVHLRPGRMKRVRIDPLHRRRIVDHFVGTVESVLPLAEWFALFKEKIREVVLLLEKNSDRSVLQARHLVNACVARRLEELHIGNPPVLYPLEIEIDNQAGAFTRLKVVSQDTPIFLYAMSNALSIKKISIEHVRIQTQDKRIEDLIDIVNEQGERLADQGQLDQVKFSVLITKQFTHFIGNAPDPYAALMRFEKLVEDVLQLPGMGQWMELLTEPKILKELAQLLGASDFLWEDMIRQQYETLLPMLSPQVEEGRRFAESPVTLPDRLESALADAHTFAQQQQCLNVFKDKEIFLFDLDHILTRDSDFRNLSENLTFLAEVIIRKAVTIIYADMAGKYGRPRTVAGLETKYAVLGLGKFGGAALGYASDIELMFVYSDSGSTDGEKQLSNMEFFDLLVKTLTKFIRAKREGIFNIDLRLRPFGNDGPLACSLESLCRYYDKNGPAHAAERLALVRLRAVAGDHALGSRIERLRDEFIYATKNINISDLRDLRKIQFKEKTRPDVLNAKFSPGALVDLEYDVQLLQIIYGQANPLLRTPRTHRALKGLKAAGVLSEQEMQSLISANAFLRNLINGLRMLRGSAKDLFLPPLQAMEYTHLAKRLGYVLKEGLAPEKQLHLEFETRTAEVRAFVERHFGRDSLPGPAMGNAADVVLSEELAEEVRNKILQAAGFGNPERANRNLRKLAGESGTREQFARLAVLAVDVLKNEPDPDMALNNWEHFINHISDRQYHFERLYSQPMRLEILLGIFSSSQFLSDTLAKNPGFYEYVTDPDNLYRIRTAEIHGGELEAMGRQAKDEKDWMNQLRKYRRREMLRIGTRDIALRASLQDVTLELSNLADALVQAVLNRVWEILRESGKVPPAHWDEPQHHFCILAFGKLGSHELNYSSDIDLVGICDDAGNARRDELAQLLGKDPYALVMEMVHAYLSQYTEEGTVYRVDLRLRPYGIQGRLIPSAQSLLKYYQTEASLGEIQSLLKMRPIAGNMQFGRDLLESIRSQLRNQHAREAIVTSIEMMRNHAIAKSHGREGVLDIKSGKGGIRDIEFLVQGLQMIHSPANDSLLEGNTLKAISLLAAAGLMTQSVAVQLADDYVFLRRVEHYLQIMEDRQIHALPQGKSELTALAKRMQGIESDADHFLESIHKMLKRVRKMYEVLLLEKQGT